MRAYHRGRLLFCPRNSHFDQFEFFAGAATVDFTTETSSPLFVRARRVPLPPFGYPPPSLSLTFPSSRPALSRSLITFLSDLTSLSLSRACVKSHLPSHVLLPSA